MGYKSKSDEIFKNNKFIDLNKVEILRISAMSTFYFIWHSEWWKMQLIRASNSVYIMCSISDDVNAFHLNILFMCIINAAMSVLFSKINVCSQENQVLLILVR